MKPCLFFACLLVVTISCNKSGGNLESRNNEGINWIRLSRHVIASNGNYSKSHTYRADGRPLSSKVFDGGTEVCRIDYYYK